MTTELRLEALNSLMEALDEAKIKKGVYPENALAVFVLCGLVIHDLLDQVQELHCTSCGTPILSAKAPALDS